MSGSLVAFTRRVAKCVGVQPVVKGKSLRVHSWNTRSGSLVMHELITVSMAHLRAGVQASRRAGPTGTGGGGACHGAGRGSASAGQGREGRVGVRHGMDGAGHDPAGSGTWEGAAVPKGGGAVGQLVGGDCQSVWGRLLSVTNAIEADTCRQGDSGRAKAGRPGEGRGGASPPPMHTWLESIQRRLEVDDFLNRRTRENVSPIKPPEERIPQCHPLSAPVYGAVVRGMWGARQGMAWQGGACGRP